MTTATGTVQQAVFYNGRFEDAVELLDSPLMRDLPPLHDVHAREFRLRRGDTVASLLADAGIRDQRAIEFLRHSREADHLFRQLVPGRTITLHVTAGGELQSLAFPLGGGKDSALTVSRLSGGFSARLETTPVESAVTLHTATIDHSLFGAADDAGIPDTVTNQLADIFGGDIDFHRDLRKGDRLSVIYETTRHLGRPIRSPRILAAEFINSGRTHQAFWYEGNSGQSGYYNQDGNSLKRAFLRSPLEFSRISSGFSSARYHPLLQKTRAHRGVDYAAAPGSRVKVTGDGIIEFAGTHGGYGKVIMIRHAGDKTTVYGHLSGFAANIRKGGRVSQGDVIGYVGATGLASGPHLHYEFRVAGVHRNPQNISLPPAAPLGQTETHDFRTKIGEQLGQLAMMRHAELSLLD